MLVDHRWSGRYGLKTTAFSVCLYYFMLLYNYYFCNIFISDGKTKRRRKVKRESVRFNCISCIDSIGNAQGRESKQKVDPDIG